MKESTQNKTLAGNKILISYKIDSCTAKTLVENIFTSPNISECPFSSTTILIDEVTSFEPSLLIVCMFLGTTYFVSTESILEKTKNKTHFHGPPVPNLNFNEQSQSFTDLWMC